MPIRPQPFTAQCLSCGWQKLYAPISDAFIESVPKVCPECGGTELKVQQTTAAASAADMLKKLFRKLS